MLSREEIDDTITVNTVSEEKSTTTNEKNILFIRQGEPRDGFAEVIITEGGIAATATFHPPSPGGAFLSYNKVSEVLEANKVVFGIDLDAVQNALFQANSSRAAVKDVIIARAAEPVPEIPEHFVIRTDLIERKPEIDPEAASIDWHQISPFCIVQIKEPIAKRIPKVDGVGGTNIYGAEVSFPVREVKTYSAGTNVIEHEKGLFAGKSGRVSIDSKGVISIEDVLLLKKGVDFTTGNITFPGDVICQGKIADGFKIYSGGSFVSSEVVDATEIVCKKDMIIQAGIEGSGKGAVRVGGSLTAKYIQNCRVAVRGTVNVSGSIVKSLIYSMDTIRMGDTGKLVGGECIVIGGVQALDIGNAKGVVTRLRCGTDFTVQQELDLANEQLKQLALKIQKAEAMYREEPGPELEKAIYAMKAQKTQIANKIPTFLPRIDTNDKAFVEVRGTIYPGVEIEICHVAHSITKAQKQVIFTLDKERGIIAAQPLKKA